MTVSRRVGRPAAALALILFFALLTVWFTYPQIRVMDHTVPHQDPLFSTWRIAWIAHQLPRAPLHLLDANILHPARASAVFSDAAPLLGIIAAPLFWLDVPAVVAYNVMLLLAFVTAGLGAFLLVRELTGSAAAGIVAGILFAFSPFRFEHYWHLEIVWSWWIPMALWALHRTIATGGWGYGLLTGLFIAAQALSCVYLAVFLAAWLTLIGLLMIALRVLDLRSQAFQALVVGVFIGGMLVLPYGKAYMKSSDIVGVRSTVETRMYSAQPYNYLASPASNRLYGWTADDWGENEKRLFPGIAAVALALIGLWPLSRLRAIYLIAMLFAFDMSLGYNGLTYGPLRQAIPLFAGLRVPARATTMAQLGLAVLAGFGVARLMARGRRGEGERDEAPAADATAATYAASAPAVPFATATRMRTGPIVVAVAALLAVAEYSNKPLFLMPQATRPWVLERWLARQKDLVLLQLPVPDVNALPGEDPRYQFISTFHWQKMVNGYSAFLPPRYGRFLQFMETFPDERSMGAVRARGVTHIILHLTFYPEKQRSPRIEALRALPDLEFVGLIPSLTGLTAVFRVLPPSR